MYFIKLSGHQQLLDKRIMMLDIQKIRSRTEVTEKMKNNIIKTLALLLSINCCIPGMPAEAEEPEEKAETSVDTLLGKDLEGFDNQDKTLLEDLGINGLPQFHSDVNPSLLDYQNSNDEDKNSAAEDLTEIGNKEQSKESRSLEDSGLRQLQIPQKLEVVIDPWEMDGKGQIYSEEYMIRNDGETPGTLTLSNLACKVSEQSGAVVTANRAGIHDNSEKSIYMQMVFGNGDRVELSEDRSTYQVELQPGEELSICFEGEVNEYASESWQDGDVAVTVVYSWSAKPATDDTEEKEETDQDVDSDISGEEEEVRDDEVTSQHIDQDINGVEVNEKEEKIDGIEAEGEEITENREQIEEKAAEKEDQTEKLGNEAAGEDGETIQSDKESKEPEEDETSNPPIIELRDFKPIEFAVDKWEIDEDGKLCSMQYVVKNAGETTGLFTLSDLIYMSAEQSGIAEQVEKEKVEISESKSMPAHMELVLESGERIDFSREVLQEEPEKSGYRAVLRPGEELKFQFIGEFDEISMDGLQKGDIAVKVIGSWDEEEAIAE